MEQNTIKRLLNAWEINNGVDQSMLTNFDNIKITELDSNDEAFLYRIEGLDNGYDYCTTIVTYGETDLFAMSDWQVGDDPKTIKEIDSEDYNWRSWQHHSGKTAVIFLGLPRVI